jgi:mono/diheme cytochrome c family protein
MLLGLNSGEDHMKVGTGIGVGIASTLAVIAGALLLFIYSGEYNVAATQPHYVPVRWALNTTMVNSVRDHAEHVEVPSLGDSSLIRQGFSRFEQMCVMCHGAPGVPRGAVGKGLRPVPPELAEAVPRWTPAELFWIVKHGIKMTGMPAWGVTHEDQKLWAIVAFLRVLPETSPAEYQALKRAWASGGGHQHGGGSGPTHGHGQEHGGGHEH